MNAQESYSKVKTSRWHPLFAYLSFLFTKCPSQCRSSHFSQVTSEGSVRTSFWLLFWDDWMPLLVVVRLKPNTLNTTAFSKMVQSMVIIEICLLWETVNSHFEKSLNGRFSPFLEIFKKACHGWRERTKSVFALGSSWNLSSESSQNVHESMGKKGTKEDV